MPYCPYCGVEVDIETVECPLCGTGIPRVTEGMKPVADYPRRDHELKYDRRPYTRKERLVVLWLVSLVLLIPLTVVLVVDLFLNRAITWSVFPMLVLGSVWLMTATALFQRSFWKLFSSLVLISIALCFGIGIFLGSLTQFIHWQLPIILIAVVPALACFVYGCKTRQKGLNIFGAALWGVAAFCVGLDMLIGINGQREGLLHGWSVIVSSALLPLGALMMYIHYRFGKTFPLKRYFHV